MISGPTLPTGKDSAMVDIKKISEEVLRELEMPTQFASPAPVAKSDPDCAQVPGKLEHSLLVPDLTQEKLLAECRVAQEWRVAAVCVAPYYVHEAARALAGTGVAVCAAIGFPSAFMSTEAKVADVRSAIVNGAAELDIAVDIAAVKSGNWDKVARDFGAAADVARSRAAVKAVFEHGSYTDAEKEQVLQLAKRCGVEYVKIQNMTSGVGARVEEIALVRRILGRNVKIKIDGGVKTLDKALELFAAGADRIGLTATAKVAAQAVERTR